MDKKAKNSPQEPMLSQLINTIPVGVVIYKVSTTWETLYYNDGVCALSGHTRDEYWQVVEKDAMDIVYEADRPLLRAEISAATAACRKLDCSYRICHKNGGVVWVHLAATRMADKDGFAIYHAVFMDISDERQTQKILRDRAEHDSLTGVLNRVGFERKIASHFSRNPSAFSAFIMVDIDNFKKINDLLGHTIGDDALCGISRLLAKSFGPDNLVARMGGDEFAVFLYHSPPQAVLLEVAQQFCEEAVQDYHHGKVHLSCSAGLALSPTDGADFHTLYTNADEALLWAKNNGKNQCKFFSTSLESFSPVAPQDMEWLLDETSNAIYICNADTYELLYLNRRCRDLAGIHGHTYVGTKCYQTLLHQSAPCPFCKMPQMSSSQFYEREATVEETGAHYILRGKLMNWNGVRTHVEFITDNTQRALVTQKLQSTAAHLQRLMEGLKASELEARQQKEKFNIALKSTNTCIWEYDIANHTIYQSENSLRVYPFPPVIPNVPEVLLESGRLAPESIPVMKRLYQRIHAGMKNSSCELHWLGSGGRDGWWAKVAYTSIFDENNQPIRAIGSSENITAEKNAVARYNEELAFRDLVVPETTVSFRLNLTGNQVEECAINDPQLEVLRTFSTVDSLFQHVLATLVPCPGRGKAVDTLNRAYLLECFDTGNLHFELEYRRTLSPRNVRWLGLTLNLIRQPSTQNILAFLYTRDITREKTMQAVVDNVVRLYYDYIVCIDGINNRYIMFSNSAKDPHPSITGENYEEQLSIMTRRFIPPAEQEEVLRRITLENIFHQLETTDIYEFVVHNLEPDGSVRYKKLQYSYMDFQSRTILLTRTDVTALFQAEQHHNNLLSAAHAESSPF